MIGLDCDQTVKKINTYSFPATSPVFQENIILILNHLNITLMWILVFGLFYLLCQRVKYPPEQLSGQVELLLRGRDLVLLSC